MVLPPIPLLFFLLLDISSRFSGSPAAAAIPSDNRGGLNSQEMCGGQEMYYTPLIRKNDHQELGVCESSCKAVEIQKFTSSSSTASRTARKEIPHNVLQYVAHPVNRRMAPSKRDLLAARHSPHKRAAAASPSPYAASFSSSSSSGSIQCDHTKTLPEEGVPDDIADNFPFHSMTCWVSDTDGYAAQVAFEEACSKAQGQFTNPFFKTWK